MSVDLLFYEKELYEKGFANICGIDEAGRGPLAGPLFVGAAIMDTEYILKGVNDSKCLTPKQREELYPGIIENAIGYKTVEISVEEIDRINILNATKLGMVRASEEIFPMPDYLLVDAVKAGFVFPYMPLIKGDTLSYSIACASILAKVERDALMLKYAEIYPEYGFEKHKGYGTPLHIEMLKKYGPCPLHRTTFIKNFIGCEIAV